MKRKKVRKLKKVEEAAASRESSTWIDGEGVHVVGKGAAPTNEELDRMTEEYQRQVRNSPLWGEMVRQFGKKRAKEMLKEFRAKLG